MPGNLEGKEMKEREGVVNKYDRIKGSKCV